MFELFCCFFGFLRARAASLDEIYAVEMRLFKSTISKCMQNLHNTSPRQLVYFSILNVFGREKMESRSER